MKKPIKILSFTLASLLALALLAACGAEEGVQSQNKKDNAVVIATANEAPTLAPHQHSSIAGNNMNLLTHNTMLKIDLETLEPTAGLIESWGAISDTEWRLHVRQGVKFHDGSDMNAEDIVASLEYARAHAEHTASFSSFWESAKIESKYVILLTTKEPYAKTLDDLAAHFVLSSEQIAEGDDAIANNPMGTGPYTFVEWVRDDHTSFEAFEGYWEGKPEIDSITYRIIPESNTRSIALETGEVDFVIDVDNKDMPRLHATEGLNVLNQEGTSFNFMAINNELSPFDNVDFRHFMNCAINKEALVAVALNGAGQANYTQTPTIFGGAATEIPDKHSENLAQEYLEKSGIDPKGVSFTCLVSDDIKRRCAEVIQADLAVYGVHMEIEQTDLATYLDAAYSGNYEACIGGYTTELMLNFVEGKFSSHQIGGLNWTRTVDPKIDEMCADILATLDNEARDEKLTELANYINEICPQIPTYSQNVTRAYNDDLQNVHVSASDVMYWHDVSWAK